MINELTPDQIRLMEEVKNEWLSAIFIDRPQINQGEVRESIEWLYKLAKLKKPQVLFVDSPLAVQYACNMLSGDQVRGQVGGQARGQVRGQVRDQVWDQVWGQVWGQVGDQVGDQVWDQVWDQVRGQVWGQVWGQVGDQVGDQVRGQVGDQVRDQVWGQVWGQVGDQVWDQVWGQVWGQVGGQVGGQVRGQVWDQVGDQKLEVFTFSSYGNIWDFGWLSFYDFFNRIGIKYKEQESFNKFKNLIRSGIYDMVQLDGLCVVCSLPEVLKRDGIRMHSETDYAIKWSDGYGQHYLHGIYFDEKLWKKIISQEMSFKEVMAIDNIEQRMIALKMYDAEKMIDGLSREGKALLMGAKTTRGNELYQITGLFARTAYFVKYNCPSTDRVYVSGVDPEIGKRGDADECMAWKHFMTKEEYMLMTVEA